MRSDHFPADKITDKNSENAVFDRNPQKTTGRTALCGACRLTVR
jgi:hypothetical protein